MHLPLSLHSSWPPCNILSISLCNAQLRNLLHQREEKTPPASLFSQRARWNFSGVTPADYSRVVFYTHTHTHTFFLSLSFSFPFVRFLFPLLLRIVRSRPGERRRPARVHTRNTPGQCCFRNSLVALYREHDRIAKVYKESRV